MQSPHVARDSRISDIQERSDPGGVNLTAVPGHDAKTDSAERPAIADLEVSGDVDTVGVVVVVQSLDELDDFLFLRLGELGRIL